MSLSNYAELAVLNALFQKTSSFGTLSSPPTLYIALCTAAPNDASTGSTLTEASYTGYARKSTSASDWAAAASGALANGTLLAFAACTAGSSTVTHFALVDASSNGNVITYGALDASLAVSAGITPQFAIGALITTAD